MAINFETELTDSEMSYIKDVINRFREDDARGSMQIREVGKLVDQGMSLADAFMNSKNTSEYMKEVLESIEDEEEREREAETTYEMIKIMDEDKVKMPIFFDDKRIVFNDFTFMDLESFLQGVMNTVDSESLGNSLEAIKESQRPENVAKRLRRGIAACRSAEKIIESALFELDGPFKS